MNATCDYTCGRRRRPAAAALFWCRIGACSGVPRRSWRCSSSAKQESRLRPSLRLHSHQRACRGLRRGRRGTRATQSPRAWIREAARSRATKSSPGAIHRPSQPRRCGFTCITTPGATPTRPGCANASLLAAPPTRSMRRRTGPRWTSPPSASSAWTAQRATSRASCDSLRQTTGMRTIGRSRRFRCLVRSRPVRRSTCRSPGRRTSRERSRAPERSATSTSSRSGSRRLACWRTADGTAISST